MNLETRIVHKDIHGVEVDHEGIIHPIIKSNNTISRVSILNESYEDVMRWICDHIKVHYLHCIILNIFEEDHIHNEFMNEGLTYLLLESERFYTLSEMKKISQTNSIE